MTEKDLIGKLSKIDADWSEISQYAYSFQGQKYWGSFDKCSEIAMKYSKKYQESGTLPESPELLRTCLFFEQRSFRHMGWPPSENELTYIRDILRKLHECK